MNRFIGYCEECIDELEAALEEKEYVWQAKYDLLIQDYEQKWGLSMRQAEQIAALTARIKELEERIALLKGPSDQIYLDALARIKELEEALEKILLCSDAPSCHRIVEQLQAELEKWERPFDQERLDACEEQASRQDSLAAQRVYITALEHAYDYD
jgi:hypothetical protein